MRTRGSAAVGLVFFALLWMGVGAVSGWVEPPPPDPTQAPPGMTPIEDRLAPPPTVDPPTQADDGAQVFYLVCMACHGDVGQGLTEEWRNVLPPPDNDCWSSGCHNSRHPPEGFTLPTVIPAVVGSQIPAKFQNAQQLHDYVQAAMPWQDPGVLTEEEYWQLTAFLMRLNGRDPGVLDLNEQSAAAFTWEAEPARPASPRVYLVPLGAILVLVVLGAYTFLRKRP